MNASCTVQEFLTAARSRISEAVECPQQILERTCLWRTVSDSISGSENCTVTRRSPAHWLVMSEGNRHVFNHLVVSDLGLKFFLQCDEMTRIYLWIGLSRFRKFLGV